VTEPLRVAGAAQRVPTKTLLRAPKGARPFAATVAAARFDPGGTVSAVACGTTWRNLLDRGRRIRGDFELAKDSSVVEICRLVDRTNVLTLKWLEGLYFDQH